jgi:hypothetical protein
MRATCRSFAVAALVLSFAALAGAQPAAPAPPTADKGDAKQLMQTGVRLLEAHDYLGALEVFKSAYERFPSAKILLNIGTTLKLLDRRCEAANAYQHYLSAVDSDPARRPEVQDALTDLDKGCGQLELTVEPGDAELEVGSERVAAAQAKVLRVPPGPFTVRATREGFQPGEQTGTVSIGEHKTVALRLTPTPASVETRTIVVHDSVEQDLGSRSRFAAIAEAHISVLPRVGSAWLIGASVDISGQLAIEAALLLGPGIVSSGTEYMYAPPSYGAYVGASYEFFSGKWRPRVAVALPTFYSAGELRFVARAAGGVEYLVNRHFSLIAELGVERNLNHEGDIDSTAFVPSLAANGRL